MLSLREIPAGVRLVVPRDRPKKHDWVEMPVKTYIDPQSPIVRVALDTVNSSELEKVRRRLIEILERGRGIYADLPPRLHRRRLNALRAAVSKARVVWKQIPPNTRVDFARQDDSGLIWRFGTGEVFVRDGYSVMFDTILEEIDFQLNARNRFRLRSDDTIKLLAAHYARTILELAEMKPTKTIGGAYFALTSVIYEGITGKSHSNLERQCRKYLDHWRYRSLPQTWS